MPAAYAELPPEAAAGPNRESRGARSAAAAMAAPDAGPSLTPPGRDPAHDVLLAARSPIDVIFEPRNVAVIGATERPGSIGRTLMWNLLRDPFGGTVYPVNPKRASVLGVRAYPSPAALPEPIDLAVVVSPAAGVPQVVRECAAAGARGAVIISAGFREAGPAGAALERAVLAEARAAGMRVLGPNCLGVMRPLTGFNATFGNRLAHPGKVGFLSQSGAMCTAILDWSLREHVGFSAFVSVGSMADIGWGDLIDYLGRDPHTASIVMYMESVGDARSFMSAAREVALTKPIIVLKPGRSAEAARAAASHTGALTGSDEVLRAAFARCGVLRVDRIDDLFDMAEVLGKQPLPRGRRLTVLTSAGGPGVLATDALVAGGGALAELSEATRAQYDRFLPPHWSHANPVDIIGDATPERYRQALEVALADPDSDGTLVIIAPQALTDPTDIADQLVAMGRGSDRPVLASWMGGVEIAAGEARLNAAGIPTFAYPDTAVRIFNYMWQYHDRLRGLYETPDLAEDPAGGHDGRAMAAAVVDAARAGGRTLLTEVESKQVMAAYGIPTVPTVVATSAGAAVAAAKAFGYPVAVKLHSETVTHKTDVGGVKLDVGTAAAVRAAFEAIRASVAERAGPGHFLGVTVQPMVRLDGYELIVGSSIDPQFGPVLLFGGGGTLVEVYRDRALGLPPLTTTLSRRLMEGTRVYQALGGVRGRAPVDLAALAQLLVRFSRLVVEQPWVAEVDINPLVAAPGAGGLVALDARVVLHPPGVTAPELPRPAIRPYPAQYAGTWTAPDGTRVRFRPIRPEDEPLMVAFQRAAPAGGAVSASPGIPPLPHEERLWHDRLIRTCFVDYDRELALVAEVEDADAGERSIVAVGRLSRPPGAATAEFAMLVADRMQRRGIGTELVRRMLDVARAEGVARVVGRMLPSNVAVRAICHRLGFTVADSAPDLATASIDL